MPMQSFNRSRITGEIIDDSTLALAAETHGIKLSETSVGRMFQYSEDTGEFGRREAAKKIAANEFKVGDKLIYNNIDEDWSEEYIVVSLDRDVIVCQSTNDDSPGGAAEFGIFDPNIERIGSKKVKASDEYNFNVGDQFMNVNDIEDYKYDSGLQEEFGGRKPKEPFIATIRSIDEDKDEVTFSNGMKYSMEELEDELKSKFLTRIGSKKVSSSVKSSSKEGIIKSASKNITVRDRRLARLNRSAGNVGQRINIPELGGSQYLTKKLKGFKEDKAEGKIRWEVESEDGQPSEVIEYPDGTFKMA